MTFTPIQRKDMKKSIQQESCTRAKVIAGAALCLLFVAGQPVQAAPGSRYTACASCSPKDLVWGEGEFDQVLLVTAPGDARNRHPQALPVDWLSQAVAGLRLGNDTVPLLDENAAASLAQGLSKALAKADPRQDAVFLMTSKPGGGLLGTRLGNSGRAFVDEHGLNLIFGEAHVEFVGRYRATRMERPFDFGIRDKASTVTLAADHAVRRRKDWLIFPLAAAAAPESRAPALAPQAVERDERYYLAQEARLKGLKRLREQNLIDEQEYQAKRSEILKAW